MSTPAQKGFLRDRLPWIIAVVAVVAMAGTMYASRDGGRKKAAENEALERVIARLDAIEGSQRGPNGSGASRGMPGMSAGGSMPGAAPGGLLGEMHEAKTPEQMAAERDKQMRELEAQFARDVADPVGGGKAENTLEKTVTGETMAGTGIKPDGNVDIACKKNSCRIVSSFAKMGDAQDWGLFYITAAGGNVLSQTQMVFVPKPDGSTEVRIYANRAKG